MMIQHRIFRGWFNILCSSNNGTLFGVLQRAAWRPCGPRTVTVCKSSLQKNTTWCGTGNDRHTATGAVMLSRRGVELLWTRQWIFEFHNIGAKIYPWLYQLLGRTMVQVASHRQPFTAKYRYFNIIYNKPTRCNSGSIVFINNYKYAVHVSAALCVHLQEHYKL